jgi:hypothetical protein
LFALFVPDRRNFVFLEEINPLLSASLRWRLCLTFDGHRFAPFGNELMDVIVIGDDYGPVLLDCAL